MVERGHKTIGALLGTGVAVLVLSLIVWESVPPPMLAADPMPAGGTAGIFAVNATADFADLDPNDDDVVIYSNATDGGLFIYDASSTATVSGTSVINGPNSKGRFLRFNATFGTPTGSSNMGNVTGVQTVDWSASDIVFMTLTGNVDLSGGFTDPASTRWITLVVTQNATGTHIITWPTLLGTAPVLDATANATTVFVMFFDGTNYHVY